MKRIIIDSENLENKRSKHFTEQNSMTIDTLNLWCLRCQTQIRDIIDDCGMNPQTVIDSLYNKLRYMKLLTCFKSNAIVLNEISNRAKKTLNK